MRFALLLIFTLAIQNGNCAKILGIVGASSFSHFQLGQRIYNELSARGHDVTVLTPFAGKDDLFKTIYLSSVHEYFEGMKKQVNLFDNKFDMLLGRLFYINYMGLQISEVTFKDPNFQKFLKTNETFDLIIIEQFVNDAIRGLEHRFKAPCVIVSPMASSYWFNAYLGIPLNPAYIPDITIQHAGYMGFWTRMKNALVMGIEQFAYHHYFLNRYDDLMHQYFPDAPPLKDFLFNTSLALINSHPITATPVPLPPNAIEIGGYHVKPPKKLPEDLQKFLDDAKDGVVYFSMGSNLKSKDMSLEKRRMILNALSKVGKKVMWKFEEDLKEKPSNVYIYKWLPQSDILAHPNIKLFITHGGLLSTIEASYHGVPVIGIPIFGDQRINMENTLHAGVGLVLDYQELTEESLSGAIKEILNNNKYSETAKMRSKYFHDRPVKPLDLAMYWIEYVIRHKGTKHLRSAALDYNWWELLLLDVILFSLVSSYVAIKVLKLTFKMLFRRKSSKVNEDKKTK